jgi:hypothetical protein
LELAARAGEWEGVLREWHQEAVTAVDLGRAIFRGTAKAPAWRGLKARGGGRARIVREGTAIEAAWATSDPAWTPQRGLTLAGFQQRRLDAEAKANAHAVAAITLAIERGLLVKQADALYDLCVKWYVLATAVFPAATAEGKLIRTVPTNYDLNPPREPAAGDVPSATGFVPVLVGDGGSGSNIIPVPFVPWPERVGEGPVPMAAPAAVAQGGGAGQGCDGKQRTGARPLGRFKPRASGVLVNTRRLERADGEAA